MNNTYINPAFPIQNSSQEIKMDTYCSGTLNLERLDENKTVKDILQIYYYLNNEIDIHSNAKVKNY